MKFALGPARIDIASTKKTDGSVETKLAIFGKDFEGWKAVAEEKFAWGLRWARHLILRGIVGLIGFTFVGTLNAGTWATTGYAIALFIAGDLAVRLDLAKRAPHVAWPRWALD